jgi:hypothetical protein
MKLTTKMNFESYVIAAAFLLYFIVGVSFALKSNWAWTLVYMSYAMSNLGLMIVAGK